MDKNCSYQSLGVSATKEGLHGILEEAGLAEETDQLFAKVNQDIAGDEHYRSFIHCDGAGTKSVIPYLYYRETGSYSLFGGLAQDALVMNLDDAFCIGLPDSLILANAIARNSNLIDDRAIGEIIKSYKALTDQLNKLGVPLQLSGGETADCGDVVRTLVVDAVICGRIKKDRLIYPKRIVPGDVILGLSSTGRATYEQKINSGIGSNGLTLARHCLLKKEYADRYPEVVDPNLDREVIYRGSYSVTDAPSGLGMSVGEALASPTRTYAPLLTSLLKQFRPEDIHGIIHVTGGAQTKVLRFGRGNRYVKNNLFPTPPLFQLIQERGAVSWKEMYQVFNMGHRLELYIPAELAGKVLENCNSFGIECQQIGYVENNTDSEKNKVILETANGHFEYELS